MPIDPSTAENLPIRMEGSYAEQSMLLLAARIEEGLSRIPCATIEFASDNKTLNLEDLVGKSVVLIWKVPPTAEFDPETEMTERFYSGTCVSVEFLGINLGLAHFRAEIQQDLWFANLNRNCRIFQDKDAKAIIKDVLGEYGIAIEDRVYDSLPSREICVQYRESDLDFLRRLMEEEGIYFHYILPTANNETPKIVLVDDMAAHVPADRFSEIEFIPMDSATSDRHLKEHFYDWRQDHNPTTTKVTLTDYDFTKPTTSLETEKTIRQGKYNFSGLEVYDYPGHYAETADGERYARIRIEARSVPNKIWTGVGMVSTLAAGRTFKVKGHQRTAPSEEFLVVEAVNYLQLNEEARKAAGVVGAGVQDKTLLFSPDNTDAYQVRVKGFPKSDPYRAPQLTPWPRIAGVQTAVVTGPQGEEIHTDQYGRIRIQFHWDRDGERNEHSTCWVRCAMPWAGKQWGMFALPRVGQEVVVHFEEGNPDRPLVTGMVYNADNMPPWTLPDNKTQSGIKTRSSKEGNTNTYNELFFEDLKGKEMMRLHAEKDFKQTVEHNADVDIGYTDKTKGRDAPETQRKGDMTLKVFRDRKEEIGNNAELKIGFGELIEDRKGDLKFDLKNDRTEKIGNNAVLEIGYGEKGPGDLTFKVYHDRTETIGNNHTTTVQKGNHTTKVSAGKMSMEAAQEILLKCGASTVKLTPASVEIKSPQVKITGDAMVQVSSAMSKIEGSATLILKGGVVLIN